MLQYSPSINYEQAELKEMWQSASVDCSVTYVFSNGPILIGNCEDCAVRLKNESPDPLARIELDHYYRIAPLGMASLKINQIDFAHPVALSDRTEIEILGQQIAINARQQQFMSN